MTLEFEILLLANFNEMHIFRFEFGILRLFIG